MTALADMLIQNQERIRRDWYRMGAMNALSDALPEADVEERERLLAELMVRFDDNARRSGVKAEATHG